MTDNPPPFPIPFRILGETHDLMAVEKPPGLLVHPTKPNGPVTLWDQLKELLAYEIASGGQVSLINRLDRETSGIVLVAKHPAAARVCAMAMERREIGKEYLAIVIGWPQQDSWSVDAPILRLGEVAPSSIWLKRAVHPKGAVAITDFFVRQRLIHPKHGRLTLIHCIPHTGRTHQIRVHLAHSGHPVVGDKIYSSYEEGFLQFIQTGWTPSLKKHLWLPRHALHSSLLSVPWNGEQQIWKSDLPKDLEDFLAQAQ
jgi:23S rRNA pseudouridine1911/1915/1917 synthase